MEERVFKARAQFLGENLKRIRGEKGVTRKELAKLLGVGVDSVGLYENGKRLPPLDKIFDMADFLQVSVVSLTGDNQYSNAVPDVDKIILDYRFAQTKKRLALAGFLVVGPDSEGRLKLVEAGKTVHNADGTFTTSVDTTKTVRLTILPDNSFVSLVETIEEIAIQSRLSFKEAFTKFFNEVFKIPVEQE